MRSTRRVFKDLVTCVAEQLMLCQVLNSCFNLRHTPGNCLFTSSLTQQLQQPLSRYPCVQPRGRRVQASAGPSLAGRRVGEVERGSQDQSEGSPDQLQPKGVEPCNAGNLNGKKSEVGFTPSVVSYNNAIATCEKLGWWEEALHLLNRMQAVGMTPTSSSFQMAIAACQKAGLLERVVPLVTEMREKCGLRPSSQKAGREDANIEQQPDRTRLYVPTPDMQDDTVDEAGYRRTHTYLANGTPAPDGPVVACSQWDSASASVREEIKNKAMDELSKNGYVVLEKLLPAELVLGLADEFRRYKASKPEGMTFRRMRAGRDMTVPPFEGKWKDERLVRHPLVLALLARYLRNSISMNDEAAAQMDLAHWITDGAPIDDFLTGSKSAGFPILDLMVVVDTPAGAKAQIRHRDTIIPGPCASLGVHIPLTPLQLDPMNGPIGFTPGSHTLFPAKDDVVGAVPPGSVILYDSFVEHHGLENDSDQPRSALFAWYRVPGVYSGHSDENFGEFGIKGAMTWRRHVAEKLAHIVAAEQAEFPSYAGEAAREKWGFHLDSPLVEWGEERVCFSCDTTTEEGALHASKWYCSKCWGRAKSAGRTAPLPSEANARPPSQSADGSVYHQVNAADLFSQERLEELEKSGLNLRASHGRHKLALLRERGHFLPMDPGSSWLAEVSAEPQPQGWRDAIRKALGEIPRYDGFDEKDWMDS